MTALYVWFGGAVGNAAIVVAIIALSSIILSFLLHRPERRVAYYEENRDSETRELSFQDTSSVGTYEQETRNLPAGGEPLSVIELTTEPLDSRIRQIECETAPTRKFNEPID
jgi:hypothetical protein